MTKEEILRLANLSRLKMDDGEAEAFRGEISSILEYVSQIDTLVADGDLLKTPGPVRNVFRDDIVTNEPGQYRDDLIDAFPRRRGDYLEVQKILNPDS